MTTTTERLEHPSGPSETRKGLMRISGHVDLIQKLSSMVTAELVVADGFSDAEALMAMAQVFISCGAHTACMAARDHLGRDPDYQNWKLSCDDAFHRAAQKIDGLQENVPTEFPS